MVSPFETVINNLNSLGAFQFLFPFMLTAAIFYGLLRRSKVFGEPNANVAINAVVAIVAAFMVWAYPVIAGVNVQLTLSTFFFQATMATLVVIVGILIGGMFLPENFAESLSKQIGKGGVGFVIAGILIAAGILISSGLVNFIIPGGVSGPSFGGLSQDTITTIIILIILIVSVAAIVVVPGGK